MPDCRSRADGRGGRVSRFSVRSAAIPRLARLTTFRGGVALPSGAAGNYPNHAAHTRIYEFKQITGQRVRGTTVATEYPEPFEFGKNEPFYPIPTEAAHAVHARYVAESRPLQRQVVFAGRLGDYRYYNMHQAVARALSLFRDLAGR